MPAELLPLDGGTAGADLALSPTRASASPASSRPSSPSLLETGAATRSEQNLSSAVRGSLRKPVGSAVYLQSLMRDVLS